MCNILHKFPFRPLKKPRFEMDYSNGINLPIHVRPAPPGPYLYSKDEPKIKARNIMYDMVWLKNFE